MKYFLFTTNKAVRAIKVNYFNIFFVYMIQQCGKLEWNQLRFCPYSVHLMSMAPKWLVLNMNTLWLMENLLKVITILTLKATFKTTLKSILSLRDA